MLVIVHSTLETAINYLLLPAKKKNTRPMRIMNPKTGQMTAFSQHTSGIITDGERDRPGWKLWAL